MAERKGLLLFGKRHRKGTQSDGGRKRRKGLTVKGYLKRKKPVKIYEPRLEHLSELQFWSQKYKEGTVDKLCKLLNKFPQQHPRVIPGKILYRYKSEMKGLLVQDERAAKLEYYPALEELPEKFPIKFSSSRFEDDLIIFSKFYEQHRNLIHYNAFFSVSVSPWDDLKAIDFASNAAQRTQLVFGECRALLLDCMNHPATDWASFPQVELVTVEKRKRRQRKVVAEPLSGVLQASENRT